MNVSPKLWHMLFALSVVLATFRAFAFDADTIAFYGFADGAVGESASGKTIRNAVDSGSYAGEVKFVGTGVASDLVFDDDVPGRYLFEGMPSSSASQPVASDIRSVNSCPVATGTNGGEIDFAALATALSSNSAFTIEFFYKIPTTEAGIQRTGSMLTFDMQSDVRYQGGDSKGKFAMTFHPTIKYPYNTGSLGRPRLATSWGFDNTYKGFQYGATMPYLSDLADGDWHHIAIVCTDSGAHYALWCDYYSTSSDGWGFGSLSPNLYTAVHSPQTVSRPLKLLNGGFRGKVAGLRVVTRALERAEFLRAFDFKDTTTLFHWNLDGKAGDPVAATVSNVAPSIASSIARQHCSKADASYKSFLKYTGNGTRLESTGGARPTYVGKTWRKSVYDGTTFLSTNLTSALLLPDSTDVNNSPGLRVDPASLYSYQSGDSFTIEGFFYFDVEKWCETYAKDLSAERYVELFASRQTTTDSNWWLFSYLNKGSLVGIYLTVVKSAGGSVNFGNTKGMLKPNKWQHLALTYDKSSKTFRCYIDHELAFEGDMSSTAPYFPASIYYAFGANGNGGGLYPFTGMMDELRMSRKALAPEQFLQAKGLGLGLTLIVR